MNVAGTLSATKLAGTVDVLHCLGQEIRSQCILHSLSLANKTFNTVFSPFLYHEVRIRFNGLDRVRRCLESPHLPCARTLSVEGLEVFEDQIDDLNSAVQEIVAKMPLLTTFRWIGLPLANIVIQKVAASCPNIKRLHVSYPEKIEEHFLELYSSVTGPGPGSELYKQFRPELGKIREEYGDLEIAVFKDLEHLVLDNIYGDLNHWMSQLVQILQQSPGLQTLDLSLGHATIVRLGLDDQYGDFIDFFDRLCTSYAEHGGSPHRLKTLRCGQGLYPYDIPPDASQKVTKLTSLESLEEVSINNAGVWDNQAFIDLYSDGSGESGIAFNLFTPENCPNLRRFFTDEYHKDFHDYLCSLHKSFSRQLAVIVDRQEELSEYETGKLLGEDDDEASLPLPLRMVSLELDREMWKDDEGVVSSQGVLENLVASSSDCLEGLQVHLHQPTQDELDPESRELLANAVSRLPKLTQLSVKLWFGPHDPKMLEDNAKLLAEAGRAHLRYINVGHLCWEVIVGSGESWRLERLDWREMQHVELFAFLGL